MLHERLGDEREASAEPPALPRHAKEQQMPIFVDAELPPHKTGMSHHKHMGSKGAHTPSPCPRQQLVIQ
jgi:hypothetical protein